METIVTDESLYVAPSRIHGRGISTKVPIKVGSLIRIRSFKSHLDEYAGFNSLVDGNITYKPSPIVWTAKTRKDRYLQWVALRDIRAGEELTLRVTREEISHFENPIYALEMPHL